MEIKNQDSRSLKGRKKEKIHLKQQLKMRKRKKRKNLKVKREIHRNRMLKINQILMMMTLREKNNRTLKIKNKVQQKTSLIS